MHEKPTIHPFTPSRMRREARTVELMIRRYCRAHHPHHHGTGLCAECNELLRYALARLQHCPFQENKSTCAKCPVHCYAPEKRRRIKDVMRYSGPRLVWSHPYLSIMHLFDGLRRAREKH